MDLVRVWIWLGSKWITRLEALYDTLALSAPPTRGALLRLPTVDPAPAEQ
jgi:hypothetical protein